MDPVLIILLAVDALLLLCCIVTIIARARQAKKADFMTAEEKTEQSESGEVSETSSNEENEPVEAEEVAKKVVKEEPITAETFPAVEEQAVLAEDDIVKEDPAEVKEETSSENEVVPTESVSEKETAATYAAALEPSVSEKKKPKIEGAKKTADPFYIKMLNADEETQGYYNEIRNEFKSYKGVNARISKGYDSFRKNRQLIARILLSGKSIRLYLRLNAGNYENSKFHQQYVGDKKTYAEIPMLVKIKSKRGLANAKLLVADLMKQEDAVKKTRVTKVDYIETLKALKEND